MTFGINFRMVLKTIGFVLMAEAVFMSFSLFFSFYYRSGDHLPLIYGISATAVCGFLLWITNFSSQYRNMGRREGFIIVTLAWFLMSAFGAIPFYLSGYFNSYTDSFFETISGFSTTGASILTDVESVPEGLLFWRSFTHWIGGMGIIVLSVALLTFIGAGGVQLFSAEAPGPMKDKLHPRISETARRLWGIYLILTLLQTVLLLLGGMNLLDSLCHTFGSLGTGGFSTKNSSVGHYSTYIQYVIIVFMIAGATNFILFYYAFTGKIKSFWKSQEFKAYIMIILLTGIFSGIYLYFSSDYPLEKSLRYGLFHTASVMTTTGFATDNYLNWPVPLWTLLFILMFVGGSAGSTTGGIKVVRLMMVFKSGIREFKRMLHPNAVIPIRIDGISIQDQVVNRVFVFVFLYLFTFLVMSYALMLTGSDFLTSIGAVAASLGCIGPGLGEVGPAGNYSGISETGKWLLSSCMLLGRLELISVLILFSPSYWKK